MKTIGTDIIGREKEIHPPGIKTMLCFIESVQSAGEFVNILKENLMSDPLRYFDIGFRYFVKAEKEAIYEISLNIF